MRFLRGVSVCCLPTVLLWGMDAAQGAAAADEIPVACSAELLPPPDDPEDQPISLRAESLTLLPPSQPVLAVRVLNRSQAPYAGRVAVQGPADWQLTPAAHDVRLAPGAQQRLAFSVSGAREVQANAYPIEMTAVHDTGRVSRRQEIVVASAPYFKPVIDGDPNDWQDAIPVSFRTGGRKSTVSTFWSRSGFSILVAVEEATLALPEQHEHFDAVQIALAARSSMDDWSTAETADRFEYLLVPGSEGKSTCYRLASPDTKVSLVENVRPLEPLLYSPAKLVVRRVDETTCYECTLPWDDMRQVIQPAEGREFCLSVLVHDPDGTGIRDWGQAAGLWPSQRQARAWCKWPGAQWHDLPPMDSRTPWGLCSSRY